MTTRKKSFTKEQINNLASNPFTLSINEHQIRFTLEFKRFMLKERAKNNTPWKDVFRKAGYDPDVLGQVRIDGIVKRVLKESKSSQGLRETTSKKAINNAGKRKHVKTEIKELQEEVIRLQQQIEFLKKIQMLKILEENED